MAYSLRLRLFVIILVPLLVIGTAIGFWQTSEARKTAEDLYDRNLVFTAIAVARDMALLDGDAISRETEVLLSDTAGGPVRYHVYAPDGVFVTGYSRPPIPIGAVPKPDKPFAYFDAIYRSKEVRVLRLWDNSQIDGLSGIFTITVWQEKAVRQLFMRDLVLRALGVIAALISTVAIFVWFGVNIGLKPLLDLEDAISQRSPDDLKPIRRKIPKEAQGIVRQLNRLIVQLEETLKAQNDFISDAAHQLRNPIAGIRALGESILTAGSLKVARSRAGELVDASHQASNLANRLLTLERARLGNLNEIYGLVDMNDLAATVLQGFQKRAADLGVSLALIIGDAPVRFLGDPVMLNEAMANLLDNALVHGGDGMSLLNLSVANIDDAVVVAITDDGAGLDPADISKVMARFGQAQSGDGSGLGLPIAEAVARRHGGALQIVTQAKGLMIRMTLPLFHRPAA